MEKLRTHYTGVSGSTLMTDRFKFWQATQNPNESVQDWEVKTRQAGSLCEYGPTTDFMCRDKFVFGLHDTSICTELLKTHLKPDGTIPKSMLDVISEAKTLESAHRTNKLISDTSKGIEKMVHWTGAKSQPKVKKRHSDMRLRREPNTCHWCGDNRGLHPW